MKTILFAALFFSLMLWTSFLPSPAYASGESPVVTQESIDTLITTLESESARKELIDSLKLLLEQQKKEVNPPSENVLPILTEEIGVRGKINHWIHEYEKFLEKNAISSSVVHQAAGTVLALMMTVVLFFLVRRGTRKFIRLADKLSSGFGLPLVRLAFYARMVQLVCRIVILGLSVYTLAKIWGAESVANLFESAAMRGFLSTSVTVMIVAVIAVFIWESVGLYLSYILKKADDRNQTRVKTLLPIIRNIVLSVFGLLFGLMLLSEIGVNVAPLIAGAGVIGVAIGFGAQSMVKDFITGFTIVLEDIIRVGDVATLAGCTGVVERITLRKVQLRDFAGIVYSIPFSEITTIQNMTKNFSFYAMDVGIAYHENTDRVVDVMREVDADLRGDVRFADLILEPIEIVGVDRFDDSAVVIKARIKTQPVKQWDVGREYNRRLKLAFDAKGIEIPFPQRVITIRKEE